MRVLNYFGNESAVNKLLDSDKKKTELLNKVIDSNGFYALGTELMNELINWRQGLFSNKPCKNCKCSKS